MKNSKVNSLQFCSLLPSLSSCSFLGSGMILLFNKAGKSALISLIIGLFLSIGLTNMFYKFHAYKPEYTLVEKINYLFSKPISKIIISIILILLTLMANIVLFRLISFFSTQFLTETSNLYITILLSSLVLYLALKGFEVLTRFSLITLLICVVVFLFNAISLTPFIEMTNIFPIIDTNVGNIIYCSIIVAILFSSPVFLLYIIPRNNIIDQNKIKKYSTIFYPLTIFMLIIICFITLSCLSIELIKIYTYPVYIVLKKINIFNFISTVENITILLWFFYLIIASTLSFMFSISIIKEVFKIKKNIIINSIMFVLIIGGPIITHYVFENSIVIDTYKASTTPIIVYSSFTLITIIMYIKSFIKNKKSV